MKRWADAGQLECVRTAGGHRRFAQAALDRFVRSRTHQPGLSYETERWVDILLSGSNYESALIQARGRLTSWCQVVAEIHRAVIDLDQRSADLSMGASALLVISERLSRVLARITESLFLPTDASKCLLASVEGERHTLGLSFAEICLRELGWGAVWLGAMVPTKAIVEQVRLNSCVRLVGLSATTAIDASTLARIQAQVTSACRDRGVELLLGGNGPWPANPRYGTRVSSFQQLEDLQSYLRQRTRSLNRLQGVRRLAG